MFFSFEQYIGLVMLLLFTWLPLAGCDASRKEQPVQETESHHDKAMLLDTRQALTILSREKILFAHHSVGANILDGLRDISRQENVTFDIRKISDTDSLEKYGLYHFSPGENSHPKTKVNGFVQFLKSGNGKDFDIAFMKFCFVDIVPGCNVKDIFVYYKQNIEEVRQQFPDLRIIHCTVPLTVRPMSLKSRMKRMLGLQVWDDEANSLRSDYNRLLLQTFSRETIFNLAEIESTGTDSRRKWFLHAGRKIYYLASEYTDDGGHLNQLGKRVVASAMIHFLSNVQTNGISRGK